ncbi:MAG: phosphomannomutase/phosphoglucomutase [Proteobacteria bacterium]|nr:phosphomannomutase/phosphoglucomutase [Pseudomonadota bacterium]
MDKNIFRAYDIRGDVRTQLTPETVLIIGRALAAAHFAAGSTLVVGRDARTHSPKLAENLIRGLRMQGVNVVDLGQITTPMLYFTLFNRNFDGGVMVTGSHNPIHDNGLKICRKTASFLGEDIRAIRDTAENLPKPATVEGTYTELDIFAEYESAILNRIPPKENLRIVIDAGNGVAGPFAKSLFSHYASQLVDLYCVPDGTFPNHHPDPSVAKNLADLQKAVLENHADIGLAFDGDGDRLGVVDRNGKIIAADHLIVLFAREILARTHKAVIIGDVKCSKFTFDDIEKNGGIPMMSKTGHALIKAKIRETNAALAGELSGHFFFGDRWYGFDDALNAAARILEIAANAKLEDKSLTDLLSDLPKSFTTPEIRLDCPDDVKFELAQAMYETYSKRYPTNNLDGARIDFPNGWALVRASNTQPVIVMRVEAVSESALHEIQTDIEREIDYYLTHHDTQN